MPDIQRNDPCHCGSGKKYKKCHEDKDRDKERTQLEKAWTKAEKEFEKTKKDEAEKAKDTPAAHGIPPGAAGKPNHPSAGGGNASKHSTIPAPKFNMPRKTGGG